MKMCPIMSNPSVAREFNEIKDAIEAVKPGKGSIAAHLIWSLNNGNSIDKAPNGAESILFKTLLKECNGDRTKAILAKSKLYTKEFLTWFGDWTGNGEELGITDPSSKVVDENGEPLVVWHGGAPNILVFKHLDQDNANTDTGYYEDPATGERVPVDSERTMFFSSNKQVAQSYGDIFGIRKFQRIYAKADTLIGYLDDPVWFKNYSFEWKRFKKLFEHPDEDLISLLDELSVFNPRFLKLKDYYITITGLNKKLNDKEKKAFRDMLIDVRHTLKNYTSDWLLNRSDWLNHFYTVKDILLEYATEDGIKRLKSGEIPKQLSEEFIIYKHIEKQRESLGLNPIVNYKTVHTTASNTYWCGFEYDGKDLYIFRELQDNKKVTDISEEELKEILENFIDTNNNAIYEMEHDEIYSKIRNKSQVYPVFLNIKNPLSHDYDGTHQGMGYKQGNRYPFGYVAARQVNKAIHDNNDGVVYENLYDPYLANNYGVFNANQIKSALLNNGEFSVSDPNQYHSKDDYDKKLQERISFADYIDRQNRWLRETYPNYDQLSKEEKELIKYRLIGWFNKQGFTHFRLKFHYDRDSHVLYGESASRSDRNSSDIKNICNILGVDIFDTSIHTPDDNTLKTLIKSLFHGVHGVSSHMNTISELLQDVLKDSNVSIQFVDYLPKGVAARYDYTSNTVLISRNAAFRNDNDYENTVALTVLHELLHASTVNTIQHSPELKLELEKLLNKVKDSAQLRYLNEFTGAGISEYGLTNVYEFLAELSNEKFVRLLQTIRTGSERKSLLSQIVAFIHKVINKTLMRVNKEHQGTAYADAMELLLKASFPREFNVKMQDKIQDDQTIFNIISARQQAALDESQRLIVRMNVLHRLYEKMKDKTISQLKIADRIFETLNKLKLHRNIEAVGIALEQAKLSLGQYDPATGGPATLSTANIYSFLYNAKQNSFDGVEPQQLVDMYRNTIKFYGDLISGIPSEQVIDLTNEDKNNIRDLKSLINDHIMPLWIEAIMKVGDDIVDSQIDEEVESSVENREDMKKVAKDWLHKNLMYGDINAVTSYVYNYSYSSNPIIKQAFHLIQHAELRTLEEMHQIAPKLMRAYLKANKGMNSVTPGWQSIMMEMDDKGIPTGNFIRELNYGLYQKDLNEFIKQLNLDFINKYGYTYVTDDTGAVVNSLTGEFADDEEWGSGGVMPKYVEYLLEIERFKLNRIHRRFTPLYYFERLSKPYDGTIDPMSPEFSFSRFDHGLSPKTLKRYSYYQSNINYYLNKCLDENTGLVYPERLDDSDKRLLEMWTEKLERFTNIFNEDGSYKTGEDLKMAYEVRAWQKWIGQRTDNDRLQDQFNAEKDAAYQKSIAEGNPSIYRDFMRFNASAGINPDFIKLTVGDLRGSGDDNDLATRGKLLRASLLDQVKVLLTYTRSLKDKKNNPLFWLKCKAADLAIADSKDPNKKASWTKDKVKKYQENFYDRDLLYIDDHGFYVDENGNSINPNDPIAKSLEEAGKLVTFRQYLINEYTNEALTTGQVAGLIDESTGMPIDFSGLSLTEIRKLISSMLSYKNRIFHDDGSVTEVQEPLTIFLMVYPRKDTFFNTRIGKTENTITYLGERRFKESTSLFRDPTFDPTEGIAEKPDKYYDGGRYDNSEAYNKMRSDKDVAALYDLLVNTMAQSLLIYSTNRKFNYKLPAINAHTAALFSRILKRGYSTKALKSIWQSISSIEANDDDMRTKQDYFVGVDGEIANDVPLKFIRQLKDPENISTDLVSSVILFADMALNYKNKSGIDASLKLLRYNMDPNNREIYDTKLRPKSEPASKGNKQSIKMYDSMMNILMYGNKYGDVQEGGPSKSTIALLKTADAFLSLESSAMLGLNMFSMSVGFADSITRILSESVAGKYMTTGDCLWALAKCLWYTPQCIWNMFNPLANNKMTALMQMNGISKGTYGTYVKADWGKGRKFLSNMLMGGWSMLDWMANALLMTAFYHNCRFFEGLNDEHGNELVPAGFYSKYDLLQAFLRAGRTKHEANLAHHNYSDILRINKSLTLDKKGRPDTSRYLGRITLWDAYEFAPYVKDSNGDVVKLHGQIRIRPEYEKYVTQKLKTRIATKTKKRGGLYNGMNPDNDVPRWKRDVIGRLVGALRGWIVQLLQHLIAGGTDNVAREFHTEIEYETTSSGTRTKLRDKKNKLTDELRARRSAWDYETGTTLDLIAIGLWRSIQTLYRMSMQTIRMRPRTAKLSEVEKYAWKDAIIFFAMLAIMMVGWVYIHDDARTVEPPKNREEAGPATWWNPVDYYDYISDVYIPNQYWKLAVDDIYFRTVEAKISNINPQQVLDIVSAVTALKSGLDDQLGVFGIATDIINGEDNDEMLKQGAYKFYTKGDRTLYRAIGPAKNLHTALTYYGATNNLRWYTNKFGTFYRAFGYDFKQKDKDANKERSSNFTGGSFQGGGFSGGNFAGGNF